MSLPRTACVLMSSDVACTSRRSSMPDSHSATISVTTIAPMPLPMVNTDTDDLPTGNAISSSSRAISGSTPMK